MRIVRQGVFETNSSSAHSLTFKKGDNLVTPKYPHNTMTIDVEEFKKFNGEPSIPRIYTSFEDRVNYILASIWTYFSFSYPVWVEIPKEYYDYAIQTEEDYLNTCKPDDFYAPRYSIKFFTKEYEGKFYHLADRAQLQYYGSRLVENLERFLIDYAGIVGFEYLSKPARLETPNEVFFSSLRKDDEKVSTSICEWFYDTIDNSIDLDYPLPLDKLLDGEWLKDFLFSESTKICIGTTDSPIDPKLIGNSENRPIYTSNESEMRKITKKYELVLNSVSYKIDKNSESGYSYNNPLDVFRGVK